MEVIKRKININEIKNSSSVNFKIPLYQTIDVLGLLTDIPFDESLGLQSEIDEVRSSYYKTAGILRFGSDSKLEIVKSYDANEPYIVGFDIRRSSYTNFSGETISNAVDKVISKDGDEIKYTVDAKKDSNLGTDSQVTGILYTDNPSDGLSIPEELDSEVTITEVQFFGQGWNETNTSFNEQIQEDYLLGIISEPEVESDVFIDRTTFSVLDRHLRLSEISNLDQLSRYGNGFYNINRD